MKKQLALLAGASVLSLLGACGGGSDADPIDKYVGTWSSCSKHDSGPGADLDTVVFTKTSASAGAFTATPLSFDTADCTGASAPGSDGVTSASFTIAGTKTIAGKAGDKIMATSGADAFKQVFYIANGTLTIGLSDQDGGTRDAEGYPNEYEAGSLTKK